MTMQRIFSFRFAIAASALALWLSLPAVAAAAPTQALVPPITIGAASVGASGEQASLLIPVRYPIEFAGRVVETQLALLGPKQRVIRTLTLRRRLGGGRVRHPDKRQRFTFVHQLRLDQGSAAELRSVRVDARGVLDIEGDGRAETRSRDRRLLTAAIGPRRQLLCGSIPHLRIDPGKRLSLPLPACDRAVEWSLRGRETRGLARIDGGRLIYRAPKRFRGSDRIHLVAERPGGGAHASRGGGSASAYGEVTVGAAGNAVVRAFGDSVTAGFGFFSTGEEMEEFPIGLYECRPAPKEFNDACSSNSRNDKSEEGAPNYALDYGLGNKVSWAAQWSRRYGITNYKNFAISGSEPKNWAPGGEFHQQLEELEKENPDYVLFTLGANPLLSRALLELREFKCELSETFRQCIEKEFTKVELQRYLGEIYAELVSKTKATIFVMQYHLAIPWSDIAYTSAQVAEIEVLLNREITTVAKGVNSARLKVVAPPHFSAGVNPFPLFPTPYTCPKGTLPVDGPSAQSEGTQDKFAAEAKIGLFKEFCGGPSWIIDRDTGIHPNTLGYARMASRVPAPQ